MPTFESPDPADLTAVPALLAAISEMSRFTPSDCIVVVGVDDSATVSLHFDLPPTDMPIKNRETIAELFGKTAASALEETNIHSVSMVGYGDGSRVVECGTLVEANLRAAGLEVTTFARVEDDRYWSYTCSCGGSSQCCPPEGSPLDQRSAMASSQPIPRSFASVPGRNEAAGALSPVTGEAADRFKAAINEMSASLTAETLDLNVPARRLHLIERGRALVDSIYERVRAGVAFEAYEETEIARLLLFLQDPFVRDLALVGIGVLHDAECLEFWRQVSRRAIPGLRAAPACLTAHAAMRLGQTAMAEAALEAAATADPDYAMASFLRKAMDRKAGPQSVVTRDALEDKYRKEIDELRRAATHGDIR